MRKIARLTALAAALTLTRPNPALAQPRPPTLGDRVRVTQQSGPMLVGTLTRMVGDTMHVLAAGADRAVAVGRTKVTRVELSIGRSRHARVGALVGAAIGGGAGAAAGSPVVIGGGAVAGLLAGAVIGRRIETDHWVATSFGFDPVTGRLEGVLRLRR